MIELIQRDPAPPRNIPASGPTTQLDHDILRVMRDEVERPLASIRMALAGRPSTHDLFARVRTLVDKGFLERIPTEGGPQRGPGASRYRLVRDGAR